MKQIVRFSEAVVRAAQILKQKTIPEQWKPLLLRDVYGRYRLALDTNREENSELISQLEAELESLGAFAGEPRILFHGDVFDSDTIFQDPSILLFQIPKSDLSIRLLDRQV